MTAAPSKTPSAPEKMKWWQKALFGLAIVVAWIVVGIFATKFYFAMTALTESVDRQFAALKRGDLEAAYAEMAADYRERTPFATFREGIAAFPHLSRAADRTFHERTVGTKGARLRGTLVDDRGEVHEVQYDLVEENGVWRIRSFEVAPATKPKG